MKVIVFINEGRAVPTNVDEFGDWKIEELDIQLVPTKCKVTVNKRIFIDDVFVHRGDDGTFTLFNNYNIRKHGYSNGTYCNSWAVFDGVGMVLQFKSDDFVIELSEQ